jgi:hypothetical protein
MTRAKLGRVIAYGSVMTPMNVARHRLSIQHIARATFEKPSDVVGWLGAVQAQDYLGALWAVGLRTRNATDFIPPGAGADRRQLRWI